jgi:Flp pilus assembly protein protease CpaA
MMVLGLILVFIAWALPQVFPMDAPPLPGIDNILWTGGWILFFVGFVLFLLAWLGGVQLGRGIGAGPRGRRYWY